ncbi:type III secretion apparatus [Pandoraea pneumonica]|jgi:type III secretion system SsaH family protein|uniref:Type III secretion apparatus n=1 Tax=Pandoraea pneumonica TaxID=2508299 RepID=A0A5E4W503_9BURK|nr:DUF1039 domain-containing protein [Pandoraea pneumonica]VVE18949.1 type III secretion apparatus [Pandoraea pneumonica]
MTPGTFEITPVPQVASPHEVGRWLDASTRQMIVELAFAGACHGMTCEARTILGALPHLVDDTVTQHWLHAALLLALGDTDAARNALARDDEGDVSAAATVNGASDLAAMQALHQWLAAMPAAPASANDASRSISTSFSRIAKS